MKLLEECVLGKIENAIHELKNKYILTSRNSLDASLTFWCAVANLSGQLWSRLKFPKNLNNADPTMQELGDAADAFRSLPMHAAHPAAIKYALLEAEHCDVFYDYILAMQYIDHRSQQFIDDWHGVERLVSNFISGYLGDVFTPILETLHASKKFRGDISELTFQLEQKVRVTERLFSKRRAELKAEISQHFNYDFP
jgi:hypothetical protein